MGALTGTPLSLALLFCLFSFFFGVFCVFFTEGLRALFMALRLLPSDEERWWRICALCRILEKRQESTKKTKGKIAPLHFVGFLLYDLLFWISLSAFYTIFLYAANGGSFRLYSLALVLCGFLLFKRTVARFFARPLFLLVSFVISLVGLALRFPTWLILFFFRYLPRKKPKQLDESAEIV